MRVLLVDDDRAVLNGLRRAFVLEGYEVFTAEDGEEALILADQFEPELIVLDVLLPGLDGFTVCERLRRNLAPSVPILMLSAKDAVPDRIAGLDRGADDYLVKPFSVDELLARSRALTRRSQPSTPFLTHADIKIEPASRLAFRGQEALSLTPREFDLLETFIRHARQVLSRDQLCQRVWGYAFQGESNFVDVAVMELRKKLEAGGRPRILRTVRGHGYVMMED